jgi:hypothetical protein
MNMNFIAFSSRAKLLGAPHLDAAAAGHRDLRGHLDGLAQTRGLDQQATTKWPAFLDKIYQADVLMTLPPRARAAVHHLVVQRGRNRPPRW